MSHCRTSWIALVAAMALLVSGVFGCDGESTPEEGASEFRPVVIEPDESADEQAEQPAEAADETTDEATEETFAWAEGDVDDAVNHARKAVEIAQAERTSAQSELRPGQSGNQSAKKREQWKPAVLQVVTNFEKADVTVNGIDYPEYTEAGEEEGIVLPAGGPHTVEVTFDGKTKTYRIHLRPEETRLLIVELSGFQGGSARVQKRPKVTPRPSPRRESNEEEKEEDDKEKGRVTVYSKPKGQVLVDGNNTGENTPGTVEVEPGRHEVQVRFESGDESEKKIVRVRKGSRIKLFFREQSD